MLSTNSTYLQACLDRWHQGDESARKDLLNGACERLHRLTHVMLKDYQRLKRWEETGDVVQSALLRLYRALQTITPPTLRDFYRLATLQIRRELLDLSRHYYSPRGAAGRHHSNADASQQSDSSAPAYDRTDASLEPTQVLAWTEFHQQAEALPEEEREVFDLVWYQGLTPAAAAEVLNVCPRTVKRRWQSACLRLHDALGGSLPGV
jgi:RNA polymerase sigma-70 factor (ECF subfamily)